MLLSKIVKVNDGWPPSIALAAYHQKGQKRRWRGHVAQHGPTKLGRMRAVFDEALEPEPVATKQRYEKEMYRLLTSDLRRPALTVAEKMGKMYPI